MNGNKLQMGYFILNHIPYTGYSPISNLEIDEGMIYKKLATNFVQDLYNNDKLSHSRVNIEIIDNKNIEICYLNLDENFLDESGRKGILLGFFVSFRLENFNFDILPNLNKIAQQYFKEAAIIRDKILKEGSLDDNNRKKTEKNNEWLLNSLFEILQSPVDENHETSQNSIDENHKALQNSVGGSNSEEINKIISSKDFKEYIEKTVDALLEKKLKQSKVCGLFKVRLTDKKANT